MHRRRNAFRGLFVVVLASLGVAACGSGTSPSGGTSSGVQKYGQCIQQAGGDVGRMQKCASLLGSGG